MDTKTTTQPKQRGVFMVDVEDISQFRQFKNAISMMRGVTSVRLPRRGQLTGYEQARLDVAEERICHYDSLDDFINEISDIHSDLFSKQRR